MCSRAEYIERIADVMTGNGSMPEGQIVGRVIKVNPELDANWIMRTFRHMACVHPDGPNGNGEFFYSRRGGNPKRCANCDEGKECQIRQRLAPAGHK